MRSLWHAIPTILLLPASISALTLDCSHIRVDEQSFNLKKLGGPKTIHRTRWEPPSVENTTFTLDICGPLERDKKAKKYEDCPAGTWVCIKEFDYPRGSKGFLKKRIPIAGNYKTSDGREMDPKYTRLKNSAGNSDGKEGVIVEMHGGTDAEKNPQKAIVEFLCDKEVTGNEGFKSEALGLDGVEYGSMRRRDDNDDDDTPSMPDQDKNKNLKLQSYKEEDGTGVLRLQWKTKFACEGAADKGGDGDDDGAKSDSWGFFTWFIIIVFLLAAAYIIFGSWLNYNRYGARGWDLIPHGDTIRDIPYIVKDWGSNAVDRLKGGDSRGGYSAV